MNERIGSSAPADGDFSKINTHAPHGDMEIDGDPMDHARASLSDDSLADPGEVESMAHSLDDD